MEEEIEVVRSELRGSTGELVSYKESLDSAEGLINSLQCELHDKRAQVGVTLNCTVLYCTELYCFIGV
jgi:hypothetical protein